MTDIQPQHTSVHSGEKSAGAEQFEERPGHPVAKASFGQRTKRHCARWWWVHLIIFILIFLLIVLLIIYVAVPKISQKGVNQSSLTFNSLSFLSPTADSIVLSTNSTLNSPSKYTPTLDAFNAALSLVINGTVAAAPILYVPIPQIHVQHPTSDVDVSNQNITISNMDQLTDYAMAVLGSEYVTTSLVGKTYLHEGKLPVTKVNYNTQTTTKGLNALAGFNVTNVRINITASPGEPNLSGYAYIPNPSVMTIAMGNVTLSLSAISPSNSSKSTTVGNATIPNMTLYPGNNTLPMTGIINQELVLGNLNTTGFVNMSIVGQSAVYDGVSLPYYEKALQSNVLSLEMNVLEILAESTP